MALSKPGFCRKIRSRLASFGAEKAPLAWILEAGQQGFRQLFRPAEPTGIEARLVEVHEALHHRGVILQEGGRMGPALPPYAQQTLPAPEFPL